MSDHTNSQIHTAKAIQFRKVDNLGQRLRSINTGEAWWARDEHHHVTSTKPNSAPYDHTTPPPTPRTNIKLQTPRPLSDLARLQIIDDPLLTSPASVYSHTARHVSREGRHAARDGRYYPSPTSAANKFPPFPAPHVQTASRAEIPRRNFLSKQLPPLPKRNHEQTSSFSPRQQEPSFQRNYLPLTPVEPTSSYLTTMLLAEKIATPRSSPTAKAANNSTSWANNFRRRHSPSDIFNMSFTFGSASRRHSSGSSPEISPRSSISSPFSSFSSRDEPYKRKRIDSTDSNIEGQHSKSFNRPRVVATPTPPITTPAKPWVYQGQPLSLRIEAHPGSPVDFSSPAPGPITSTQSARTPHHDSNRYHTYLVQNAKRRNSSPTAYRVDPYDVKTQARNEKLCKEARILGMDTNPPSTRQPRKCTLGRRERTARKSAPLSAVSSPMRTPLLTPALTPTTASASTCTTPLMPLPPNEARYAYRTSSSTSDPTMEAFLTHVRASQEARAAAVRQKKEEEEREREREQQRRCEAESWDEVMRYTIFTDEDEKGFLSDEPL